MTDGAGTRSSDGVRFSRSSAGDSNVELAGDMDLPDSVTCALGSGVLVALDELLRVLGAPLVEGLPPLHSGFVGYLGYDVVREIERLPDVAHDDLGLPDSSMFLIGQLCAFDHWRQRVVLVENVPVRRGAQEAELDELTTALLCGWTSWHRICSDLCRNPPFRCLRGARNGRV